ncbi:hypothetical protein K450DRAFT_199458 [Umbelopsis ramanniana AG]|uniref:Uncharacterized protein n=1 Tax=Umbelopsis ramanniana AG TaxID=1314678 RepID=A0AAD5HCP6_UMBRA|nr:uncharacterized protein K450DRAFT_199458 [Umbelopsis ramanniana AG]KAI8579450.1 hypothetical protein K450DRAFT_199458 [Umbelopsis ramanniana AG]
MNCSADVPSISGGILVSVPASVLLMQYISYGLYQAALGWIQIMCNQRRNHLQYYTFQTSYPAYALSEFKRLFHELDQNDTWYINLGRAIAWITHNSYLATSVFFTIIVVSTSTSASVKSVVLTNTADNTNTTMVEIMWHLDSSECITYAPSLLHQATSGIFLNGYMLLAFTTYASIMILYTFICNYMYHYPIWLPLPLYDILFDSPTSKTEDGQIFFSPPGTLRLEEHDGEPYIMIGDKLLITLSKDLDWEKVNAILDSR